MVWGPMDIQTYRTVVLPHAAERYKPPQNHPQNNGGSGFNLIIASQKNLISTQT